MNNRALEFLNEASRLLVWWGNSEQGRMLVNLAIGEVQELLDRIAALEARPTATAITATGGPVLIVEAQPMTPARLTESQRTATVLEWRRPAALPGNNHKRG